MKKNSIICCTICLMALFSTACSNKPNETTRSSQMSLDTAPPTSPMDIKETPMTDNQLTEETAIDVVIDGCQEQASVKKGKILQILLPATPGTGYVWTLAKPATILSQNRADNSKYKKDPKADPMMVGGTQKQILEFKALNVGTETIDLIYSRSFEKNKIEKKCTIKITVK